MGEHGIGDGVGQHLSTQHRAGYSHAVLVVACCLHCMQ